MVSVLPLIPRWQHDGEGGKHSAGGFVSRPIQQSTESGPAHPKRGKGYYCRKPGPPIVVPGLHWLGVLVTGWAGVWERRPLTLEAWQWCANPLPQTEATEKSLPAAEDSLTASDGIPRYREREAAWDLLERVVAAWEPERVLHVWDRGFSGAPWPGVAIDITLVEDCTTVRPKAVLRFAHRTGRQANAVWRPLYGLRAALAAFWQRHTPSFQGMP
ncbi:MAG: hypothetical protein EPO21_08365 [Chloroflexota bacterium]|nr:MAG: hypothetical protein EPO21_08365 [Chloroflexota bacterium]